MNVGETAMPTPEDVIEVVRIMWNGATMSPCHTAEEWKRLTSKTPVVCPTIPAEFRWPLVREPLHVMEDELEREEGKQMFHC